jgi:hypothetical protein
VPLPPLVLLPPLPVPAAPPALLAPPALPEPPPLALLFPPLLPPLARPAPLAAGFPPLPPDSFLLQANPSTSGSATIAARKVVTWANREFFMRVLLQLQRTTQLQQPTGLD